MARVTRNIKTMCDEKSQVISDRLKCAKKNQLIFIPFNSGLHWVLMVIDMSNMHVYHLDPLRNKIQEQLKGIVNNVIMMCQAHVSEKEKNPKMPEFVEVKAPKQPGSTECGYFVMGHMRDLIEDFTLVISGFGQKNIRQGSLKRD